jgi:hypothetical protein
MVWDNWSTARKILLPASLLLLIDSFLNWQQVDLGIASAGVSMWHGLGFLIGILLLILIVWELIDAFAPDTLRGMNLPGGLITLALAAAILLFTVIRVLTIDFRHWPAWVGLLLAIAIGYGGWLRFQESGETMPSRSSMGGGTSSSSGSGGSAGSTSGTTTGGAGESGTMGSTGGMGTSSSAGTTGSTGAAGTTGGSDMGTGGSSGMGGGGTSSGSQEQTPPA